MSTSKNPNKPDDMVPASDVSDILKNYNSQINVLLVKNEGLVAQVSALEKQIVNMQDQCLKLNNEKSELERRTVQLEGALELFKEDPKKEGTPLEPSQAEFLQKRAEASDEIKAKLAAASVPTEFKTQVLSEFLQFRKELEEAYKTANYYKGEATNLKKQASEEEKERKCENCGKYYHPRLNAETSCVYHPGKIRYYSCKTCGADPYHICCGKCDACSPGCRTQRHIS